MNYKISRHAQIEIRDGAKNIPQALFESVLNAPGQVVLEERQKSLPVKN